MSNSIVSVEVEKLSEFIEYLEQLPHDFILSRGHSKDFPLLPSAFRQDNSGNRLYRKTDIQNFLESFQINSHPYITNTNTISNEKEWMVYAQHYGIPTKLLDFTYSHIISLMFSLENAFNEDQPQDGVIWFLNPNELNSFSTGGNYRKIYNISTQDGELDKASGPIAVTCKKMHERINAQNGVFVYFQEENYSTPLEKFSNSSILKKVIIKKDAKKELLKSLNSLGVGFTSIYPELSSVSKDIMLKRNIQEYISLNNEE